MDGTISEAEFIAKRVVCQFEEDLVKRMREKMLR